MKKRIAFIVSEMDGIGGVSTVVKTLAHEFAQELEVIFIGENNGIMKTEAYTVVDYDFGKSIQSYEKWISVIIRGINRFTTLLNNRTGARLLEKFVFNQRYKQSLIDVIVHNEIDVIIGVAGYNSMLLGSIADELKQKGILPLGWQLNSYDAYFNTPNKYLWHQDYLFRNTVSNLDNYVVLTEHDQNMLFSKMNIDSSVIYNPKARSSLLKSDLGQKRIIAAGHLWYGKGFDLLLESASFVFKQYSDWKLDIYGTGPMKSELENQIIDLGLTENVTLPGNTANLFDELLQSSIFALSSRWEGMPMVVLDALEAGIPVVAYDITAMGPMIENQVEGVIVEKFDTKKYADAIIDLIANADMRKELGINAASKSTLFDQFVIANQWKGLIEMDDRK